MKRNTFIYLLFCGIVLPCFMAGVVSEAQIGTFTKEDIIEYTPLWKGERFPDGRPKVPDSILERMKKVTLEEVWNMCERNGYYNQYEGG